MLLPATSSSSGSDDDSGPDPKELPGRHHPHPLHLRGAGGDSDQEMPQLPASSSSATSSIPSPLLLGSRSRENSSSVFVTEYPDEPATPKSLVGTAALTIFDHKAAVREKLPKNGCGNGSGSGSGGSSLPNGHGQALVADQLIEGHPLWLAAERTVTPMYELLTSATSDSGSQVSKSNSELSVAHSQHAPSPSKTPRLDRDAVGCSSKESSVDLDGRPPAFALGDKDPAAPQPPTSLSLQLHKMAAPATSAGSSSSASSASFLPKSAVSSPPTSPTSSLPKSLVTSPTSPTDPYAKGFPSPHFTAPSPASAKQASFTNSTSSGGSPANRGSAEYRKVSYNPVPPSSSSEVANSPPKSPQVRISPKPFRRNFSPESEAQQIFGEIQEIVDNIKAKTGGLTSAVAADPAAPRKDSAAHLDSLLAEVDQIKSSLKQPLAPPTPPVRNSEAYRLSLESEGNRRPQQQLQQPVSPLRSPSSVLSNGFGGRTAAPHAPAGCREMEEAQKAMAQLERTISEMKKPELQVQVKVSRNGNQ